MFITGAGISAESGISTFRDSDGIWEKYDPIKVAYKSAWRTNREELLEFHNILRRQVQEKKPNSAHIDMAKLQTLYDVYVITTNVDNFHERAGSAQVLHLHGNIMESKSTAKPNSDAIPQLTDLNIGDKHPEDGSQLRPSVVWFGEDVPNISFAVELVSEADILVVVGTSMSVYPAASVIDYMKPECEGYMINPEFYEEQPKNMVFIQERATTGLKILKEML